MKQIRAVSKRFLALFFLVSLIFSLVACGAETVPDDPKRAAAEQEAFDHYLEKTTADFYSGDTMLLHQLIGDPSVVGLKNPEVTLGNVMGDYSESKQAYEQEIQKLESFSAELLTEKQRLTRDIMIKTFQNEARGCEFPYYQNVLSTETGVPWELFSSFSEYAFYEKQDVENYFTLLSQTPRYFDELIEYANEQSKAGLFPSDRIAEQIIEQCKIFGTEAENHTLFVRFDERIEAVDFLSESEKDAYQEQNRAALCDDLFPSYLKLAETVEKLKGTGKNDVTLVDMPQGKAYYECLVRAYTGSKKSVSELKQKAEDAVFQAIQRTIQLVSNDPELAENTPEFSLDLSEPKKILDQLEKEMEQNFPKIESVSFQVCNVPSSMETANTIAYYLIPPLSRAKENNIFLNRSAWTDSLEDFLTLAHEGFPGHLYQWNYFLQQDPDPIRCGLGFLGYMEGWSKYASLFAYDLGDLSPEEAEILKINDVYGALLYAVVDIGANYEGWSQEEAVKYLAGYSIPESSAKSIYDAVTANPAQSLSYGIGFLEILELRQIAEKQLGDQFDLKAFHTFLLDVGPAHFELLNEQLEFWIEHQKESNL